MLHSPQVRMLENLSAAVILIVQITSHFMEEIISALSRPHLLLYFLFALHYQKGHV